MKTQTTFEQDAKELQKVLTQIAKLDARIEKQERKIRDARIKRALRQEAKETKVKTSC